MATPTKKDEFVTEKIQNLINYIKTYIKERPPKDLPLGSEVITAQALEQCYKNLELLKDPAIRYSFVEEELAKYWDKEKKVFDRLAWQKHVDDQQKEMMRGLLRSTNNVSKLDEIEKQMEAHKPPADVQEKLTDYFAMICDIHFS